MPTYVNLVAGEPAPYFQQRSFKNPNFTFDTAAGRYIVMCFFGSSANDHSRAAIAAVKERPDLFDDTFASFFGVTIDPADNTPERLTDSYPGYRYFLDFDMKISREYGSVDAEQTTLPPGNEIRRIWMVLDPTLRIMKVIPFQRDQSDIGEVLGYLDSLPPSHKFAGFELQAPIIVLPNVFEPEFCKELINLYETNGGEESGFMQQVDGKTIMASDHKHKQRRDYNIQDNELIALLQRKFMRRVVPEIAKIHQFHCTRMERYIVSCYAADEGGHFRAHRDDTTSGTAHRRFAVSVNLNDEFEGGEVSFPEYGPRSFKAPAGGAVVFSCSLLHAVSKVTSGRRYAFLPFLYDDAAAEVRRQNNEFLGEGVGHYGGGAEAAAS